MNRHKCVFAFVPKCNGIGHETAFLVQAVVIVCLFCIDRLLNKVCYCCS